MEIINPTQQHTHTFILLHGKGSTASEFRKDFFESQASDNSTLPERFPSIKWVLPTAQMIIFDGEMSQWFEMCSTDDPFERQADQQSDLAAAVKSIHQIIDEESSIVGAQNIILGGISQGCAVAIHALLNQNRQLGGFVGLCSWLPSREGTTDDAHKAALGTPVFLSHSQDDDVIAIKYGEELRDGLSRLGMEVQWRAYIEGGHWVNEPQGVDDLVEFLNRITRREA